MSSLITPTALARIAAKEYRSRHQRAHEAIRAGEMDVATATGHLRPWLAIACLCGADLPELDEGLADLRNYQVIWPVHLCGQQRAIADNEARARLAHDICPRARWEPILIAARNRALDRFTRPEPAGDAETEAATALVALANRFRLPGWRPPTMADAARAQELTAVAEPASRAKQSPLLVGELA